MHIYKAMGYGIADPQYSAKGYLTSPSQYDFAGFRAFMQDSEDFSELKNLRIDLSECIHFGEVDGKNVLCIVPPAKAGQWVRVDNSIDMAESEAGTPRISFLTQGLPGHRTWMDCRNGKWVSSSVYYLFNQVYQHYTSPKFCGAEKYTDEFTLSDLASDLGFRTMGDVLMYVAPCVPTIIDRLCAYLNLFIDSSEYLKLRPMVYTYWK